MGGPVQRDDYNFEKNKEPIMILKSLKNTF